MLTREEHKGKYCADPKCCWGPTGKKEQLPARLTERLKKLKQLKRVNAVIDLKPQEASILSLIAEYAPFARWPHCSRQPWLRSTLLGVLKSNTKRAQSIGKLLLDVKIKAPETHHVTARRFEIAAENNRRLSKVLWPVSKIEGVPLT